MADRWHLLKNPREAVENLLARFSPEIRAAAASNDTDTKPSTTSAAVPAIAPESPASEPLPVSAQSSARAATATEAAEIQAYRRKLFDTAADTFRQRIKDITAVEVCETAAEVEPASGTVVTVFTSGTVVQV